MDNIEITHRNGV